MKGISLPLLILAALFYSCIPNKKIIYLQEKGEQTLNYDSLLILEFPDYQLQVGDLLKIDVKSTQPNLITIFSEENRMTNVGGLAASGSDLNYMTGFPINKSGNMELPLVGEVYLEGKTVSESKEIIQSEIRKYVSDAFVQVRLGGIRYTALGEFRRPGRYSVLQSQLTIYEALANAGDLNVTADREHVVLIRQYGEGSQVHELDLTDAEIIYSDFYYIRPNDLFYVRPLPVRQFGGGVGVTGFQSFTSVLSAISSVLLIVITARRL